MINGIQKFLVALNDNWVTILVCVGLIIGIIQKTRSFFSKSTEEQVAIAKAQISETVLKLITSAEIDFDSWSNAGSIKRSQVIEEIFEKYPILSKATSQDEIIAWIDNEIDSALVTLREIMKSNTKE